MKAYSMDLRERELADGDAGMRTGLVAKKYRVSPAWLRRSKQRRPSEPPAEQAARVACAPQRSARVGRCRAPGFGGRGHAAQGRSPQQTRCGLLSLCCSLSLLAIGAIGAAC